MASTIILIIMVKWLLVGNTFHFHIKEVPSVLTQMVRGWNLCQCQNGTLQEFVGWQQLELKDSLNVGKKTW